MKYSGILQMGKSFGFVVPDNKEKFQDDIFVPKAFLGDAEDGNYVEFELLQKPKKGKKLEGKIVRVITDKGGSSNLESGTFSECNGYGFVTPEKGGQDIYIFGKNTLNARTGDSVKYKISRQAEGKNKAEGRIVEIVKKPGDVRIAFEKNALTGRFNAVKDFGFIRADDGNEDLYVFNTNTLGAEEGDIVAYKIIKEGDGDKKAEARVIEVLKQPKVESRPQIKSGLKGIFNEGKGFGFIKPEMGGEDLYVFGKNTMRAREGDVVFYEIIREAENNKKAEAKVLGFGEKGDIVLKVEKKIEKKVEKKEPVKNNLRGLTGTFRDVEGFASIAPDNGTDEIFVFSANTMGAVNGDKVSYTLTRPAADGENAEGKVVAIAGKSESDAEGVKGKFRLGNGFGFIIPEDGSEDLYVFKTNTNNAKDGDTVLFEVTRPRMGDKKPEARVVKVLGKMESSEDIVTDKTEQKGSFIGGRGFGFIKPENGKADLYVLESDTMNAKHGDVVSYIVVRNAKGDKKAEAKVTKIHEGEKLARKSKKYDKNLETLDGVFTECKGFGFVTPLAGGEDLYVFGKNTLNAKTGELVKAVITKPGFNGKKSEAEVMEVVSGVNPSFKGSKEIEGIYRTTRSGLGFVDVEEDGKEKGYYVHFKNKGRAFHGDKVKALIKEFRDKEEALIVDVIERGNQPLVGEYKDNGKFGFVELPNSDVDVFITRSLSKGAQDGECVGVIVTEWNKGDRNPTGKIMKVLGKDGDNKLDIESIIYKFGVETEFTPSVLGRLDALPVNPLPRDFENRVDLRNEYIFSIDGADAKDLDDAISVQKNEDGGYKLKVHIADVAHYVKERTPLDKEAYERGTSVYLPDRVIPMLPKKLSNGLCSLNPNVPRLAMTAEMDLSENGVLQDYKVYESVIESKHRLTYDIVRDIIEGRDTLVVEDGKVEYIEKTGFRFNSTVEELEELKEKLLVAEELRVKVESYKKSLGVLDFDFPEAKVILNRRGRAIDIKKYERHFAHRMIEEFMILANESISKLHDDLPFLYRTHGIPLDEKTDSLRKILAIYGITLPQTDISPKVVQDILKQIKGTEKEQMLQKLVLRSLSKAEYTYDNVGHFGLALTHYSHFTSPIRRYPDLQIHRIMKEKLAGNLTAERVEHYEKILTGVGGDMTDKEINAEKLEYAVIDMKKCEYMESRIGETFTGMISGAIPAGFFVELDNTVEGFVSLESLEGSYKFDSNLLEFVGAENKYSIGDNVKIVVTDVSKEYSRVSFEIVVG